MTATKTIARSKPCLTKQKLKLFVGSWPEAEARRTAVIEQSQKVSRYYDAVGRLSLVAAYPETKTPDEAWWSPSLNWSAPYSMNGGTDNAH